MRRGITTSVVALGQGSDVPGARGAVAHRRRPLLPGRGRHAAAGGVHAGDHHRRATSAIVEEPFHVALGAPSSITAGVPFGEAPPLKGYVVTVPKGRSTVLPVRAGGRSGARCVVGGRRPGRRVHERSARAAGRRVDALARRGAA